MVVKMYEDLTTIVATNTNFDRSILKQNCIRDVRIPQPGEIAIHNTGYSKSTKIQKIVCYMQDARQKRLRQYRIYVKKNDFKTILRSYQIHVNLSKLYLQGMFNQK